MNTTYIIIGLIVAGFGTIIYILNQKFQELSGAKDSAIEDKIARIAAQALKNNTDQFFTQAKELFSLEKTNLKDEIKLDLEAKKSAINELITEIRKDLKNSEERLSKSDEERIKIFSSLQTELKSYKEITGDLKISTDELKVILSNNQMRGSFGEQIAEDLLKMAGFVIGSDYKKNESQSSNTRPDFTIFLPDKTKINIDVKFPYSSLIKYTESDDKIEKNRYWSLFKQDVRNKIKQVTTRDYINPDEKTVDFVVLFIPNEMIFSAIYEKMNDVWDDAMKKKVIMAGPFSFTAILRMVKQAYSNFRYQENLQHIITLIQKFDKEYETYSAAVDNLGERIKRVSEKYDEVSGLRSRQLTKIVDKIKVHEVVEEEETKQLSEKTEII